MGDFVTPAELASALQMDVDTATATLAIAKAESLVRSYTGQTISAVASHTVSLDGVTDVWLALPQRPVTAVTLVKVDGVTVTDWTLRRNRLYRAAGWCVSSAGLPTQVDVTYAHGFAVVPEDVRTVTLEVAARAYSNPKGFTSETAGPFAYSRDTASAALLMDERLVLRRYRRPAPAIQMLRGW